MECVAPQSLITKPLNFITESSVSGQRLRVLARVGAVDLVVGAHHCAHAGVHGRLERGVVDLRQGPLGDLHVDGVAQRLLVVADVVLRRSRSRRRSARPVMSAAAICEARYGSSPYPSNARPPYGVRRMLRFGASETWWPLAACSVPSAAPTDCTVPGPRWPRRSSRPGTGSPRCCRCPRRPRRRPGTGRGCRGPGCPGCDPRSRRRCRTRSRSRPPSGASAPASSAQAVRARAVRILLRVQPWMGVLAVTEATACHGLRRACPPAPRSAVRRRRRRAGSSIAARLRLPGPPG